MEQNLNLRFESAVVVLLLQSRLFIINLIAENVIENSFYFKLFRFTVDVNSYDSGDAAFDAVIKV